MDAMMSSRPDILQRLYRFRSSQRIHLLSASGSRYLKETWSLPLGMLLVDVVLHSNLFPLQHSV
ncbi:hypothetical protein AAG906_017878 [Vitis piasezkii]